MELKEVIERKISYLDSVLFAPSFEINAISSSFDAKPYSDTDINLIIKDEKRTYDLKNGLSLSGSFNYKIGEGAFVDDFVDDFMSYRSKYQMTLAWDLFQSSLFGKRYAYKAMELKAKKDIYNINNDALLLEYQNVRDDITLTYDSINDAMLNHRVALLELYLELQTKLLDTNKIIYTEYISIANKLEYIKSLYKTDVSDLNIGVINVKNYFERQVLFDNTYLDSVVENNNSVKQNNLELELLDNQRASINYIQELSIAPFVRTQYYYVDNNANTSKFTLDAGVKFSLPLSNSIKAKRNNITTKITLKEHQSLLYKDALRNKYKRLVTSINNNLSSLKYNIYLLESNKDKIDNVKKRYKHKQASIQDLCREYDNYFESLSSAYDLIYRRDLMLLEMFGMQIGLSN